MLNLKPGSVEVDVLLDRERVKLYRVAVEIVRVDRIGDRRGETRRRSKIAR